MPWSRALCTNCERGSLFVVYRFCPAKSARFLLRFGAEHAPGAKAVDVRPCIPSEAFVGVEALVPEGTRRQAGERERRERTYRSHLLRRRRQEAAGPDLLIHLVICRSLVHMGQNADVCLLLLEGQRVDPHLAATVGALARRPKIYHIDVAWLMRMPNHLEARVVRNRHVGLVPMPIARTSRCGVHQRKRVQLRQVLVNLGRTVATRAFDSEPAIWR